MDSSMASGDNSVSPSTSPRYNVRLETEIAEDYAVSKDGARDKHDIEDVTPQSIDDSEEDLRARITQCKITIDTLKQQLTEERAKTMKEREEKIKAKQFLYVSDHDGGLPSLGSSMYKASVDSKLCCDETLFEYEKQLQKYQNTLNVAQNEKKIAIRKQMLTKAFKLKLMEVENQCNIELLRIRQCVQCLEPLQKLVDKWKKEEDDDDVFNMNAYPMMPNLLELKALSGSDVNYKDEPGNSAKDDAAMSD